jgi:antitoxin (DNA-binding transcriptional repressor) of toxin-antitoxin stability system
METTIYNISETRSRFSELINAVIFGGDNIKISRGKSDKPVAVIVGADEWAAYEDWCDRQDAKTARTILRKMKQTGEKARPIAKLWRELGLE